MLRRNPTKKSDETRGRILRTAVRLFNSRGVAETTTHHIAAAASLSPGNLYYHFQNKEEIIRSIFESVDLFNPVAWEKVLATKTEKGFRLFLLFFFSQVKTYRFLFREKSHLIQKDALLCAQWLAADRTLQTVMRNAVSTWVDSGIMKSFASSVEIDAFIDNSWIILNNAYSFYDAKGEKGARRVESLVNRQLIQFLRPYHTTKGLRMLAGM